MTKLVYTLANPKKRVIGMISSIPLEGAMPADDAHGRGATPPQMVMEQIREFFEVKTLEKDLKEIPADIDVLMFVQPEGLTPEAAYAIDQYVLKGGKVLVFIDPVAETAQRGNPMGMPGSRPTPARSTSCSRLGRRLRSQEDRRRHQPTPGASIRRRRARQGHRLRRLADARQAQARPARRAVGRHRAAEPGLAPASSPRPKARPARSRRSSPPATGPCRSGPTSLGLQPDAGRAAARLQAGGKPLTLAARVAGEAKSAFPDGAPKPAEAKKAEERQGRGRQGQGIAQEARRRRSAKDARRAEPSQAVASAAVNVIVVADTDMLNDQFWVEVRDFLGQQVAVPNAHNAAFVLDALENLSGGDALIALRGRGIIDRPFELVSELRRDAERRFREKEPALTAKLKELQEQLAKLEKASQGERSGAVRADGGDREVPRRDAGDAARAARGQADAAQGHRPARRLAQVRQHRRRAAADRGRRRSAGRPTGAGASPMPADGRKSGATA